MKVHLIRTPEYSVEEYKKVYEFLDSFEGIIDFCSTDFEYKESDFPFLHFKNIEFDDNSMSSPSMMFKLLKSASIAKRESYANLYGGNFIEIDKLFSLCNAFRERFKIMDNDFVCLLTKWRNDYNFLSYFDQHNNIFVQVNHWQSVTNGVSVKYPLAYQVVENITQRIMGLNIDFFALMNHLENKQGLAWEEREQMPDFSPFLHEKSRGCINDLCWNRSDIMLKIKTANICPTCLQKILDENVDMNVIKQCTTIFKAIRNEYDYKMMELTGNLNVNPYPLVVDKKGTVIIRTGKIEIEIRLDSLEKAAYIFYLKEKDGVKNLDLPHYQDVLLNLYVKVRPNVEIRNANDAINSLACDGGKYMSTIRANIKNRILSILDPSIAEWYLIKGSKGGNFGIKVSKEGFVTIDSKF